MKNFSAKYIVILILLAIAGYISWSSFFKTYTQSDTVNIHTFPKSISGWNAEELKITDEEYDILETKNAFSRSYKTSDGKDVMLFIVYSQSNRKISHPPELCYSGSGMTLLSETADTWPLNSTQLKVNKLLFEYGPSKQVVTYWFKVGDTYTNNYWKQQWLIAYKSLLGQPASSALIRLSTVISNGDLRKGEEDLKEFTSLIFPQLPKYLI
jgi:EpsI family protein